MEQQPSVRSLSAPTTVAEALDGIERCQRLLRNTSLMRQLPNNGAAIRLRLQQHQTLMDQLPTNAKQDATRNEQQKKEEDTASCPIRSSIEKTVVVSQFQEVNEKYRHHRVNLREELHRIFGGMLSPSEINRVVDVDSSEKLLMTWDETQMMERRFAELEREGMLRRMRERQERASRWATIAGQVEDA